MNRRCASISIKKRLREKCLQCQSRRTFSNAAGAIDDNEVHINRSVNTKTKTRHQQGKLWITNWLFFANNYTGENGTPDSLNRTMPEQMPGKMTDKEKNETAEAAMTPSQIARSQDREKRFEGIPADVLQMFAGVNIEEDRGAFGNTIHFSLNGHEITVVGEFEPGGEITRVVVDHVELERDEFVSFENKYKKVINAMLMDQKMRSTPVVLEKMNKIRTDLGI